jgi:hypothetical protein
MSLFRGVHAPNGQKQQIDFSCVPEIFLYVPQIKLKAFPFPFLACNIDTLDQEFIGWSDPSNSYDFWVSSFEQKLTVSSAYQSNMSFILRTFRWTWNTPVCPGKTSSWETREALETQLVKNLLQTRRHSQSFQSIQLSKAGLLNGSLTRLRLNKYRRKLILLFDRNLECEGSNTKPLCKVSVRGTCSLIVVYLLDTWSRSGQRPPHRLFLAAE